jgi:hypothetical protein
LAVGRRWLQALKARDQASLAQQTAFPFAWKSTSHTRLCDGSAADAKELRAIVDCLGRKDDLLMDELAKADQLEVKPFELRRIPPRLRKILPKPEPGQRFVYSFINGGGVTFEFVLVVASVGERLGVTGFFLTREFETG